MLGGAAITTTIPSTNIKRTREFFEGKLGLKVVDDSENGISFQAGNGTTLYAYKRGPGKADHTLASFEVPDLEAKIDEMSKNGVVFEQYDFPGLKTDKKGIAISEEEGEKAAWFKDPDGNIFAVSQKI